MTHRRTGSPLPTSLLDLPMDMMRNDKNLYIIIYIYAVMMQQKLPVDHHNHHTIAQESQQTIKALGKRTHPSEFSGPSFQYRKGFYRPKHTFWFMDISDIYPMIYGYIYMKIHVYIYVNIIIYIYLYHISYNYIYMYIYNIMYIL